MKNLSRLTIDIDSDFHSLLKIKATRNKKSMKKYVIEAVKKKIDEDDAREDEILTKIALEAEKEGYIGEEESLKFLEKMKNAQI